MIHILWQATQVVFWVALFALIAGAPWVVGYQWYQRSDLYFTQVVVGIGIFWCAVCVVGGMIFVINEFDKADAAAHRWRGGKGPDTHCEFEHREEMVGKTLQEVVYTVCD